MVRILLIGLPIMTLCLFLQSLLLVWALRYYARHDAEVTPTTHWRTLLIINSVMMILLFGNLAQLLIWGVVFRMLGEFETLRDAVYHSAVNFATLGYGDLIMSPRNRFLGPLEAINGVLMIGVSTAALMATFQDAIKKTVQLRRNTT